MRVMVLSSSIDPSNGWGNITYEFCRRLRKRVDVELHLPQSEGSKVQAGELSAKCDLPPFAFSLRNPFKMARYYLSAIGNVSPDLVHCLFAFPYAIVAQRVAKAQSTPYLIGAQGTFGVRPLLHWPDRWFLKSAYDDAACIVVPSQFTAERIRQFSGTMTPITVLHNAVDFERFQRKVGGEAVRHLYGDRPMILSVGGLKARKGFDIMLRAFKLIKQQIEDSVYVILGEGEQEESLKDLAASLGLHDVYFGGIKRGDELVAYFQACDVYAHTPRIVDWQFEGFGIVYLEASACGKPVVGSCSGGVPDAVQDGVTGLLVPENDPQATAEALIAVLTDHFLASRLGQAGLEYARQRDWSRYVDKMIDIYQSLINGERR
jgi:phosphatidylinositol alpha-1,6-mannosyltransferase